MEEHFSNEFDKDPILDGLFMRPIQVRSGISWIQRSHIAYAQKVQASLREIAKVYRKEAEPAVSKINTGVQMETEEMSVSHNSFLKI